VPTPNWYDYAVVRVVPRVDRGEFVNAGVILWCAACRSLRARVGLDEARVLALDPTADLAAIRHALDGLARICSGAEQAGAFRDMTPRQRFDWLVAPRSASVQVSPVHCGRADDDLETVLDHLFERLVSTPR
jgi:hypothetical protein